MNNELVTSEHIKTIEVKANGKNIIVKLLQMGEYEGLTTQQAAELFGVVGSAIRKAVKEHGLLSVTIGNEHIKSLKKQGVIPLKTPQANLLPRPTLDALVKIFNTPEAWAAYNVLFEAVRSPEAYVQVQSERFEAGTEGGGLKWVYHFQDLFKKTVEVVEELKEEKRQRGIADKRAFSAMGTAGVKAKEIIYLKAHIELRSVMDRFFACHKISGLSWHDFSKKINAACRSKYGRTISWAKKFQTIANLEDLKLLADLAEDISY